MEVVLKYSNVDKQEVMLVLARRDVSILRTWDWFGQKVKILVENNTELNSLLIDLNQNTYCGVVVVKKRTVILDREG